MIKLFQPMSVWEASVEPRVCERAVVVGVSCHFHRRRFCITAARMAGEVLLPSIQEFSTVTSCCHFAFALVS
jgi:hypothetical protein